MFFKRIALATAMLASLSAVSVNAFAAASQDITLQGIITNTACDVTINGGKSLLNVGIFKSSEFTANKKIGSVDIPVTLTNCGAGEKGKLVVQGLTSTKNNNNNLFVNNDADTVGFMVMQNDDVTSVKNGEGPAVDLGAEATATTYNFKVGMASTDVKPTAGTYSAPILVAYIVE